MATPQLAAQGMMALFREKQTLPGFLAAMFRPISGSTGAFAETVTWDSKRFTDKIAGTIDKRTGYNLNTVGQFTSKSIAPPDYAEAIAIDANDLVNRLAGEDPFSAANRSFSSRFMDMANEGMAQSVALIDRSMEVQASQILQTGKLALAGVQPYVADFKPKATHFVTVGVAWSDAALSKPIDDIEALANVIKTDSRQRMVRAIFGRTALREFLDSDQVQAKADVRRMTLIAIDPAINEGGAIRYGTFIANGYEFEMWLYDEEFEPFAGGSKVTYVDENKVILLPRDPALVVASVMVPQILAPDPRVANLVTPPTRTRLGYDVTPNVWTTPAGDVVYAGVRARPVLIPQGIDEFGALTT